MNCEKCQNWICEAADATGAINPEAELHLTGCPACREFQIGSAQLDSDLMAQAVKATLPGDFKASLLAKLPEMQPRLLPGEIAEQRAQYEREYQAAINALKHRYFIPHTATVIGGLLLILALVQIAFSLNRTAQTWLPMMERATNQVTASWMGIVLCLVVSMSIVALGVYYTLNPMLRAIVRNSFLQRIRLI